ncbi:MAG TPA: adenylyl-sulfate kinase [Caldithrix abyssi]|uniref:Adenylyl-sulfate kinase n=1 Tax=Caldithrix abyssi TaxID=187145 RepID=A0A7V1LLH7_CALAY|nr:adenylyl-sulfate kinase [Caldithrix abyssi]
MTKHTQNIHPVFERMLGRADKAALLGQEARVFWMTGLSGSGKSTLAIGLEKALYQKGYLTQILDGDNIRSGINSNLGFSEEDRMENIRRIAEVSKLFVNCGIITINSFVSPTRAIRQQARQIIGGDFVEIYINASLEVCEQRDVKGLYKKARSGEIPNFTGIHQPFEAPEHPDLEIDTSRNTIEESVEKLVNFVLPLIRKKN